MGKKPDEIENDIKAQREKLGERMQSLQQRLQEDMSSVGSDARSRASSATEEAKHRLNADQVYESVRGMMKDHTLSSLAGAVGVGVVLGMVGGGSGGGSGPSEGGPSSDGRASSGASGQNGSSGVGGMISSMVAPAAGTAQDELQQLVRDSFSLLRDQVNEARERTTSGDAGGDGSGSRSSEGERQPAETGSKE